MHPLRDPCRVLVPDVIHVAGHIDEGVIMSRTTSRGGQDSGSMIPRVGTTFGGRCRYSVIPARLIPTEAPIFETTVWYKNVIW